jgi:hypothetical protein
MRIVRKIFVGLVTFIVLFAASLWATSLAIEPEPVGAAGAPDPMTHKGAVVQVYGADVWGFRGNFAIHTWVATKAENESGYTIYQVIGWRARRGRSVVAVSQGDPARPWYGSPAVLLHDERGPGAQVLVEQIRDAVDAYPFANEYKMWPGPNSNSFVAWIGLQVPALKLDLPAKAIGQAWMQNEYSQYLVAP